MPLSLLLDFVCCKNGRGQCSGLRQAGGARDSRTRNRQSLELLEVRVLYLLLSLLLALYVISWQGWSARRVQRPRGFFPWSLLAAEGKIASPERQLGFLWPYAEFYMDGGVVTTALLLLAVGWSCAAAQQLASALAR